MEFFGFASGSSKTGPSFPHMPESILNGYPSTMMEHPAVPSTAASFFNMEAPDARSLVAAMQTWADKSMALIEKPAAKAVGVGLSASICVYSAWRISQRWNDGAPVKPRNKNFHPKLEVNENGNGFDDTDSLTTEDLETSRDLAQRNLQDTRVKLEELRYQLTQLEGDKDLLEAEVTMRKKMVAQLQGEINNERDLRHQAELKMEMMEWENTHLRRLRKDIATKEGKIDVLEASLKEKDALQDKLFHENVIMPKNIAAARAKEYEALRSKVQKYEMDAVMSRNAEVPFKPTRHGSPSCPVGHALCNDTTDTAWTSEQQSDRGVSETNPPSDWEKSPSSIGSTTASHITPLSRVIRTRAMIHSATNSPSPLGKRPCVERVGEEAHHQGEGVKEQEVEQERYFNDAPRAPFSEMSQRNRDNSCDAGQEDSQILNRRQTATNGGPDKREDLSREPAFRAEDQPGMLGHIRSFFSGYSHSGSETELANTLGSPAQLGEVLPCRSKFWDRAFEDKANNCCRDGQAEAEEGDDEDDDTCHLSLSDGQSSVFMSASCGSASSDDDIGDTSRVLNRSANRARSTKRTVSPLKRALSSKAVVSPLKANVLRRGTLTTSPRKPQSLKIVVPPRNELHSESGFLYGNETVTPTRSALVFNNTLFCQPVSSNKAMTCSKSKPHSCLENSHNGRARLRCRLPRTRSKLTSSSVVSDKVGSPVEALHSVKVSHEENKVEPLQPTPSHTRGGVMCHSHEDTNKNSTDGTDAESEESWIVITPAN